MLLDHKEASELRIGLSGRLNNMADYIALKEPFKGFLRLKRGFFYGNGLKYDQNSLTASLKWAKNAFFGMPDL